MIQFCHVVNSRANLTALESSKWRPARSHASCGFASEASYAGHHLVLGSVLHRRATITSADAHYAAPLRDVAHGRVSDVDSGGSLPEHELAQELEEVHSVTQPLRERRGHWSPAGSEPYRRHSSRYGARIGPVKYACVYLRRLDHFCRGALVCSGCFRHRNVPADP